MAIDIETGTGREMLVDTLSEVTPMEVTLLVDIQLLAMDGPTITLDTP